MQQELKYEAYRMESVRKSVETTCFDRCIPQPDPVTIVAKGLNPANLLGLANTTEGEGMRRNDLTDNESLCIDRCSWKYMLTAKLILQSLAKAKHLKDPAAAAQQQGGMR
jgi:hypothetical protein